MLNFEDYTVDPRAKPCDYCGLLTRGDFGEFGIFCSRTPCLDAHDKTLAKRAGLEDDGVA